MFTPLPTATARRLCVGALATLTACADPVAGPTNAADPAAPDGAVSYEAWNAKPNDERFTVTRTIERFENRGGRLVSTGRRVRVSRLGRDVVGVKRGDRVPQTEPRSDPADALDLPPVGLTWSARRGAPTLGVPWSNRHALAGVPGVEVEASGVGDGPAATLRYFQNGSLARTVTQSYRRREGRWELVRRETTTPDGTYHEVVVVAGPPSVQSATAFSFRRGPEADDDFGALTTFGGLALDDEDCDPCKALREAKNAAFEAFIWADAAAILVCTLTPPPADVLACWAATLKASEAYSKFAKADSAYDDCMRNPPKCPCTTKTEPITMAAPPTGSADRAAIPPDAAFLDECEDTSTTPATGGGGGGSGTGGIQTCYYDIWYDVATGVILWKELLYCEVEPTP